MNSKVLITLLTVVVIALGIFVYRAGASEREKSATLEEMRKERAARSEELLRLKRQLKNLEVEHQRLKEVPIPPERFDDTLDQKYRDRKIRPRRGPGPE